jgi:hypothetical protein
MAGEVYSADTQTSTGTAVPNAGADNHISTNGSAANWSSITSESFLAGPKPGQDQVLIKIGDQTAMVSAGQRLEEIQKKFMFRVRDGDPEDVLQFDQNRNTAVTLSDTLTVGKNQIVKIVDDQNVTITRDQMVSVTNARNINARHISEYGKETIVINAGVELVIQGPGGSIKIDSTGVTIQGVVVKIN